MAIWVVFLLLMGSPQAFASLHWSQVAAHVGQNEESREAALKALSKIKNLDQQLLAALSGPRRPLALDVISARKSEHLVPDLLAKVSQDQDGYLILCINSLLSSKNKETVLARFEKHLSSLNGQSAGTTAVSPGAIVAMLEPLGRLQHRLPQSTLSSLFQHESFEVRIAALTYVRSMVISKSDGGYEKFLPIALKSSPSQLRMQALIILSEMKTQKQSLPVQAKTLKPLCANEKKSFVKARCLKLVNELKNYDRAGKGV